MAKFRNVNGQLVQDDINGTLDALGNQLEGTGNPLAPVSGNKSLLPASGKVAQSGGDPGSQMGIDTSTLQKKSNLKPVNWGGIASKTAQGATQMIQGQTSLGQNLLPSTAEGVSSGLSTMNSLKNSSGKVTGAGAGAGVASMAATMGGDALAKSGNEKAGGVLKGAGSGAAMGAAVGSIVPGVGNVVGGVAGGLVGGIAGFFSGKKAEEARKKAEEKKRKQEALNTEMLGQQQRQEDMRNSQFLTSAQRAARLQAAGMARNGLKTCKSKTKLIPLKKK